VSVVIKEANIFNISSTLFNKSFFSFSDKNSSSLDIIICVSNSAADHLAMYKKFICSLFVFLWFHSAILQGI